jgi:hypothetical protein
MDASSPYPSTFDLELYMSRYPPSSPTYVSRLLHIAGKCSSSAAATFSQKVSALNLLKAELVRSGANTDAYKALFAEGGGIAGDVVLASSEQVPIDRAWIAAADDKVRGDRESEGTAGRGREGTAKKTGIKRFTRYDIYTEGRIARL